MLVGTAMRVDSEMPDVGFGCGEGVGNGLWETTVVKDAAAGNWVCSELCEGRKDVDTDFVVEVGVGSCELAEEGEDRLDEDAPSGYCEPGLTMGEDPLFDVVVLVVQVSDVEFVEVSVAKGELVAKSEPISEGEPVAEIEVRTSGPGQSNQYSP